MGQVVSAVVPVFCWFAEIIIHDWADSDSELHKNKKSVDSPKEEDDNMFTIHIVFYSIASVVMLVNLSYIGYKFYKQKMKDKEKQPLIGV